MKAPKPKTPTPAQMEQIRSFQRVVQEEIHRMMAALLPLDSAHAAVLLACLTDLVGEGINQMLQNGGGGANREQWLAATVERIEAVLDLKGAPWPKEMWQ